MTDREKLIALFELFDIDTRPSRKSITGGGRRFYFDEKGRIEKIIDYHDGEMYTDKQGAKS